MIGGSLDTVRSGGATDNGGGSQRMRAVVHAHDAGVAGIRLAERPRPDPAQGEAVVAIEYAGLNRHELFTALRRHATPEAQILGADGSGTVVSLGAETTGVALGDGVLIDPTVNWPTREPVPAHPSILGGRIPGTFAQFVAVPSANLHVPPAHLRGPERGALGLAAVTAFRALYTVGELRAGEHVLIPGIGSGVGLLALDFAVATGAEVTVTSRSAAKREFAIARGATRAVPTGKVGKDRVERPVDLVIDTVGASSVAAALPVLRPGGRIVTLGATTGADLDLSLRDLFFRQLSIRGTSVGSAEEFAEMLDLVSRHQIRPVIDSVHPLSSAPNVMRASLEGAGQGKTVFDLTEEPVL